MLYKPYLEEDLHNYSSRFGLPPSKSVLFFILRFLGAKIYADYRYRWPLREISGRLPFLGGQSTPAGTPELYPWHKNNISNHDYIHVIYQTRGFRSFRVHISPYYVGKTYTNDRGGSTDPLNLHIWHEIRKYHQYTL